MPKYAVGQYVTFNDGARLGCVARIEITSEGNFYYLAGDFVNSRFKEDELDNDFEKLKKFYSDYKDEEVARIVAAYHRKLQNLEEILKHGSSKNKDNSR